jgi:serine/threonine-protein kinase
VLATPVLNDNPNTVIETAPRMGPNGARPTSPARVGNPQRRRASAWVMVALSLLGVVAVVALGTGLYLTSRTQTTKIPDVSGKSVSLATSQLQSHSLKLGPQHPINSSTCTEGQIISTLPDIGSTVPVNTTVQLNVCAGPGSTLVPTIIGQTQTIAASQLKNAGLVGTYPMVDGTGKPGIVLSVTPGENTSVKIGSTVTVTISKGNEAPVPTVVFESETQARRDLKAAGFTNINRVFQDSADPSQAGHVVDQSPKNATVLKSTQINIYVGDKYNAPPPTTPPPVTPSAPASPSG